MEHISIFMMHKTITSKFKFLSYYKLPLYKTPMQKNLGSIQMKIIRFSHFARAESIHTGSFNAQGTTTWKCFKLDSKSQGIEHNPRLLIQLRGRFENKYKLYRTRMLMKPNIQWLDQVPDSSLWSESFHCRVDGVWPSPATDSIQTATELQQTEQTARTQHWRHLANNTEDIGNIWRITHRTLATSGEWYAHDE